MLALGRVRLSSGRTVPTHESKRAAARRPSTWSVVFAPRRLTRGCSGLALARSPLSRQPLGGLRLARWRVVCSLVALAARGLPVRLSSPARYPAVADCTSQTPLTFEHSVPEVSPSLAPEGDLRSIQMAQLESAICPANTECVAHSPLELMAGYRLRHDGSRSWQTDVLSIVPEAEVVLDELTLEPVGEAAGTVLVRWLKRSAMNRRPPNPRLQRTRVRPSGGRSPLSRQSLGDNLEPSRAAWCQRVGGRRDVRPLPRLR